MRKRFFTGANIDLQSILNENADRHCLPVGSFPEMNNFEDEPVSIMYDHDKFVRVEDVPEFSDNTEENFFDLLDEKIALDKERGEAITSVGVLSRVPEFIAIVKKVIHPKRMTPVAACYDGHSGVLRLVY